MKRIEENCCGFSGYSYTGVPELDIVFRRTVLTSDTELARTTFAEPTQMTTPHMIDNYLNLPAKVKGFVMKSSPVLDMQASLDYPQSSCKNNVDPFDSAGFLDLFSTYQGTVQVAYADAGATSGQLSQVTWQTLQTALVPAKGSVQDTELTMYPGILQPMLDTQLSPVSIDSSAVTGTDAYLDGLMLTLQMITKWRKVIDEKLVDLYDRAIHIGSLRNLVMAANTQSICDQFQIKQTNPTGDRNLFINPIGASAPSYYITGGTVFVGEKAVTFSSTTGFSGQFYAYINIKVVDNQVVDQQISETCRKESTTDNWISMGIGGVRIVDSTKSMKGKLSGVPKYVLYQIYQERCLANVVAVQQQQQQTSRLYVIASQFSGYGPVQAGRVGAISADGHVTVSSWDTLIIPRMDVQDFRSTALT